jgi:Ser/Thr protein kinase RdoA (MazF antagonist)
MLTAQDHVLLAEAGVTAVENVAPVEGGFVNEVLRVDGPHGPVLLRRWIRANAADLELAALAEAAADGIPVPRVLAAANGCAVLSWVDGVRADLVPPSRELGRLLGELGRAVWARPRPANGMLHWDTGWRITPWPAAASAMLADEVAAATEAPAGWAELALAHTADLETRPVRVHSDFNPKNVLVRPVGDGWAVAALLDWEFTFAGPAEVDLGNLLRFERRDAPPSPFALGVREGAGVDEDAVDRGRALDLLALAQFLTPGKPDNAIRTAVRALAEHQVATGRI